MYVTWRLLNIEHFKMLPKHLLELKSVPTGNHPLALNTHIDQTLPKDKGGRQSYCRQKKASGFPQYLPLLN